MMLRTDNVESGYDLVPALQDVSVAMLSVLGSNGGGKLTLLRTISGLLATRSRYALRKADQAGARASILAYACQQGSP